MPSWELFTAQDDGYRDGVLPKNIRKRVTVEAASTFGWHRWAGDEGTIIGLDRYGASAPGEEILKHLGFTVEHVTSAALRLVGRSEEADKEYGGETAMAPTGSAEGHS
jgi:transketolase